jgi:hypothetical protein
LTIDLSKVEKEELDDRYRDHWTDIIVRPRQVIYWPNFVTRRRRRRRKYLERTLEGVGRGLFEVLHDTVPEGTVEPH